jgi:hypothetical protein
MSSTVACLLHAPNEQGGAERQQIAANTGRTTHTQRAQANGNAARTVGPRALRLGLLAQLRLPLAACSPTWHIGHTTHAVRAATCTNAAMARRHERARKEGGRTVQATTHQLKDRMETRAHRIAAARSAPAGSACLRARSTRAAGCTVHDTRQHKTATSATSESTLGGSEPRLSRKATRIARCQTTATKPRM